MKLFVSICYSGHFAIQVNLAQSQVMVFHSCSSFTYHSEHTLAFSNGTTATEEANNEDTSSDANEYYWHHFHLVFVIIGHTDNLHQVDDGTISKQPDSNAQQCNARQLKKIIKLYDQQFFTIN